MRATSKVSVTTTPTDFATGGVNGIFIVNNGAVTIYFGFLEATGADGIPIASGTSFGYNAVGTPFHVWLTAASGSQDVRLVLES